MLIVRDTRESGEMLQAAVAAGVTAAGGDVLLGGVLPTPAAPLLIARYGFDLAAVLSASHNPYQDNGIKFFGADGYKLCDETELADRARAGRALAAAGAGAPRDRARCASCAARAEDYLRELHTRFAELDLAGLDVLLDCANGATYRGRAGDLQASRRERDGASPTRPTGATSTPAAAPPTSSELAEQVRAGGHALGFAFDGDGDRVLAVDGAGRSSTATS